jgi:hypothetical protein
LPLSAVDTINFAIDHTKRQLFQPFRFWQWTKLALVGLLAGEAGGGINSARSFRSHGGESIGHFPHIDLALLGALITVIIVSALVFGIVMAYISAVMRFVLFDSILAKECHIRQGWFRRQQPGLKLFAWHLGFGFVVLAVVILLLGVPAALAYGAGWFTAPREHLAPLILGGIVLFLVLMVFFIVAAVVQVLTKDFVVPQMALEGIGAIEGWRRLWRMMGMEKGGYVGYVAMKIVLAIVAGILIGIAALIAVVLVVVPVAGVAGAAIFAGKAAGLTWDAYTITAAVVAGCALLAVLFYLTALISVPAIVFFPAYSIYFFAARYRPLSMVLYPAPPPTPPLPGVPPIAPLPAG